LNIPEAYKLPLGYKAHVSVVLVVSVKQFEGNSEGSRSISMGGKKDLVGYMAT
jgi:hypothetical protein